MQKSFTAGIVTEYNPFHSGHAWMINELRRRGAHTVVCVMSGNFVQRGTPALLPAFLRAQAAIVGGADLVLRLPVSWATASAEQFARGSVGLLGALGCVDVLAFGSEVPDVQKLQEIAAMLKKEDFEAALKQELAKGISFAAARSAAAERIVNGAAAVLNTPNNILGIEYCKALELFQKTGIQQKSVVLPEPLALPRQGASHDGPPNSGFASASWLRKVSMAQSIDALQPYVPAGCLEIYQHAASKGAIIDWNRWDIALLARLRGKNASDFACCAGAGEGLENRMVKSVAQSTTAEELYKNAKSKRYAHSRIRRLALATALELPKNVEKTPPFAHILAANEKGLALLTKAKRTAIVPLSTSLAKLERTGKLAAQHGKREAAVDDLYALCMKKPDIGGKIYREQAYFSKD